MAVNNQKITDKFAIYHGDSVEVMGTLPKNSIDLSIYSPPFADLYAYSSNERDLSNCVNYDEFLSHYEFIVKELSRTTKDGRLSCVHCMDLCNKTGGLNDFPGDIIKSYQRNGFTYHARYVIWKEPLRMALKTRAIGLRHAQIVKDSSRCDNAGADFLLVFRKKGRNKKPIKHVKGFTEYFGEINDIERIRNGYAPIPKSLDKYREGWDNPKTNKWSHWIWQHYASSVWYDIRIKHCLEYDKIKDKDNEKHICPLQLDVINRCMAMWSNPGDNVLTPFMGVGSEVCGAIANGRRGLGIELKDTYYKQAVKNAIKFSRKYL